VDTSKTPGEVSHDRRRFLGTAGAAALVVGAAQFGMIGSAKAQTTGATAAGLSAVNAKTNTSFGPVRQINAGVLNVGYVETGPACTASPTTSTAMSRSRLCWRRKATG
jgi:hypothetical protein